VSKLEQKVSCPVTYEGLYMLGRERDHKLCNFPRNIDREIGINLQYAPLVVIFKQVSVGRISSTVKSNSARDSLPAKAWPLN
jgi:hypothetical protein